MSGWLTGQTNLDVKDAAERAILKLRALSAAAGPISQSIANSEVNRLCVVAEVVLLYSNRCSPSSLNESAGPSVDPQEILRPFLLACESKHVGLVAMGLACVQKMAANGAVHHEKYISILQTLQQVSLPRLPVSPKRSGQYKIRSV